MAIKWGSWAYGQSGSRSRLGIDRSTSTTASQITVTIVVHFEFSGYYLNSNATLTASGGHSGSRAVSLNFSSSGTRNLGTFTQTFTRPWGSQKAESTQFSISGSAGGNPTIGEGYYLPRRLYSTPATPSSVTAGWSRDGVASLSWSVSASTSAPVTSVEVARQSSNNSWGTNTSTFTQRSGSTSFSGLARGNRYRWRVRGKNRDETGAWGTSGWVYMRPNDVANVVATRSGANVNLTWVNRDALDYAGYRIYDNGSLVGTIPAGTTAFTHTAPDPSQTHRYSVRAYYGSLEAAHVYSNTVQLLSAPLAPTNLNPSGGYVLSGQSHRLEWDHNPIDTTSQTAYEVRSRRSDLTTWHTHTGTTNSYYDLNVSLYAVHGHEMVWQVRTKGDHANFSPWSAVATFGVVSRPTVTITAPAANATITSGTVQLGVTFSRAPVSYRVELRDGTGTTVRDISGYATSTTHTVPLTQLRTGQTYTARVTATDRVDSLTVSRSFTTDFPQPESPTVNAWWETDTAEVHIDATRSLTDPRANRIEVERLTDGEWVYIGEWWEFMPITVIDKEAPLSGATYRATSVAVIGSDNIRSEPTEFTVEPISPQADFITYGDTALRIIHLPGVQRSSSNTDVHLIDLDDSSPDPVAIFGVKERHTTTISGLLIDQPGSPAREQARAFRDLGTYKDLVLLRTVDADPVWGIVTGVTQPRELWGGYHVSFTHTKAR